MIKIMVADDEPLQRQYLRTVLEEFPRKYKIVAEADNGEDAVAMALETKPDIPAVTCSSRMVCGMP